ncbi:hypothetical protein L5G28_04420 [Gordonia sp. HY285]|uniref:hypothetical protein n=1 Tax=Gordonia liuliyuniae TaxID=2911517 RepID=UPI001F2CBECD|nr:hypothetical protein [Gordonia liuliyuniae]MCF8609405.1 hypothetical protein [Gordonia liuliyuniae]
MLYPDYGASWGLWSGDTPSPEPGGWWPGPKNFGFSEELESALRTWLDQWQDNFAQSPQQEQHTWPRDFDVDAWMAEGDRLADMIETELPEFTVERGYLSHDRRGNWMLD